MPLTSLTRQNIHAELDAGNINDDYAQPIFDFEAEINLRIYDRVLSVDDEEQFGPCPIDVYFMSPRPGNYKDWIWIEVHTLNGCYLWLHITKLDANGWSWSIWKDSEFIGSFPAENFNMPPDFVIGPVYKTINMHKQGITAVINDICQIMPSLCNC
jgi:hypothetical protein